MMLFVKPLSLTFATKLRVFSSVKLVRFFFYFTFHSHAFTLTLLVWVTKCSQNAGNRHNCLVINDHFGEPCSALWTNPPLSGGGELFSRCTLPVSTFLSIEPLAVLCCVRAIMSVHCTLRRTKEAKKKA